MADAIRFVDKKTYLHSHTEKIKSSISTITDEFMLISYLLWEVKEYSYFDEDYSSIVEYSEINFGFKKSTTNQYILLCEQFSAKTQSGCPSSRIAEKYKGYSSSLLIEMLPIPVEHRDKVKSDTTIKQVRELKKELKSSKSDTVEVANDELKSDNLKEIVCGNCGKGYLVDEASKKQWIIINDKPVASCCFQIKFDTDILKDKDKCISKTKVKRSDQKAAAK